MILSEKLTIRDCGKVQSLCDWRSSNTLCLEKFSFAGDLVWVVIGVRRLLRFREILL